MTTTYSRSFRRNYGLTTRRDGSEQELSPRYWTLHVIGAQVGSQQMTPLYQRLWPAEASDFVSENEEILGAVDAVRAHVGNRGIWVMDRGGTPGDGPDSRREESLLE